jgi:hypothetical protein
VGPPTRFSFLTSEQALQLRKLEADVDAGKIDLLRFYELVTPIFKIEQEMNTRLSTQREKQ